MIIDKPTKLRRFDIPFLSSRFIFSWNFMYKMPTIINDMNIRIEEKNSSPIPPPILDSSFSSSSSLLFASCMIASILLYLFSASFIRSSLFDIM